MMLSSAEQLTRALGGDWHGSNGMARCPVHRDGRASLSIGTGQGGRILLHCFAGCEWNDIIDALRRHGHAVGGDAAGGFDPDLDAAKREAKKERARQLWGAGRSITGTLAETYLRKHRQIGVALAPDAVRFLPASAASRPYPALIAAMRDPDGFVTAVQLTYLEFGSGEKARVQPSRVTRGVPGGSAVKLAIPKSGELLGLAEGLEDALSVIELYGVACWAALGTENLPGVKIPSDIRHVHIFADKDRPGIVAAQKAGKAHLEAGLKVTISRPASHKDFNDYLRGKKNGGR